MRARLAFLLLASCSGFVIGCGGGHSSHECRAEVEANTAYAGSYVVTYTPDASSSAQPLRFNLTVLPSGFVSGSGTDLGTGQSVTLTASSGDLGGEPSFVGDDNDCDDKAYVRVVFTRSATTTVESGAVIEEIRGSVNQTGGLAGTYKASNLLGGDALSTGTITVEPAAVQAD